MLNTTDSRREELRNTYYFTCECEKCKEPSKFATAAVCSSCLKYCDVDDESCLNCGKKITLDFREKFKEVSEFTANHLNTMKNVACILFFFFFKSF